MSSPSEPVTVTHTLDGSCHCKAVKFVVKDVDLAKIGRCNCTLCTMSGRISVFVKEGNLLLVKSDGTQLPLHIDSVSARADNGFPPELTVYDARGPKHHFCNKCGIHLFIIADIKELGGIYINANVLCLDLKKAGKDVKDVADPSKLMYTNGREETWAQRKGEPWAGGVW